VLEPLALLALLVAFVVAYDWTVVAPGRRRWPGRLVPVILASLALPLVLPTAWIYGRAVASAFAVMLAVKSYELHRERVPDPGMLERLPLFCFWLLIPPRSKRPANGETAAVHRAEGRRRMLRAALKLPPAAVLVLVHLRWPALHDSPWVEAFWALWMTYFGTTAFVDLVSGLAMQTGVHVAEAFHAPPLARSPRDFWGQRWNLIVNDLAYRLVFLPLGGIRRPLRSTLAVFVISGVVHEYFIVACLGRPSSYTGWMMLFFLLHGAAVMLQLWWDRGRGRNRRMTRPVAVTLHMLWLSATAPLFFFPMGEVFRDAWPNG
ncbi:MAG: hypothetical protein KDK70_25450, partial [Myxococcales bacterium]|nr:hypothetical protein [Myxococcales bacterium]